MECDVGGVMIVQLGYIAQGGLVRGQTAVGQQQNRLRPDCKVCQCCIQVFRLLDICGTVVELCSYSNKCIFWILPEETVFDSSMKDGLLE